MLFRSRSFLEAIAICNEEAHYLPDGRVLFLAAIYFCHLSLFYFCKLVVPAQLHSANILFSLFSNSAHDSSILFIRKVKLDLTRHYCNLSKTKL